VSFRHEWLAPVRHQQRVRHRLLRPGR
jgi:hypothetical protein